MTVPSPSVPQPTDPISAFGIGNIRAEGGDAFAEQQLSARFADHRGRIELAALAVLFDDLGGIPFHVAQHDRASTLQARLNLSFLGHVDVDDRLSGTSRLSIADASYGSTAVEIRTGTGHVCCIGTARNVRVGRPADAGAPESWHGAPPPGSADAHGIELPRAIEPTLSGADVVGQIVSGVRGPGPLAELLGGRLEVADDLPDGSVRFVSRTRSWMGNMLGTMHGGVIGTLVAQACSFAAQAHAAPGRDYQVGDLAIGFYRSPLVQGDDVIVDVTPVRIGRRIGSFEATMRSADGLLLSQATADAYYR